MVTFALGLFLITLLSSINGSHQANCDDNEFTCADETCLDSFLVCDGEKNCPDGSDETKEVCSKSNIACQPFAFRCAYGACIDGNRKCDGRQDCADNSDENHPSCSGTSTQSNTISTNGSICQIGLYRCDSGQCIDEYMICDGEDNCRDGTDETKEMCINFPCPSILGFQCDYGGCIDKLKRCNGVKDCKDGSDENPKVCGTEPVLPNPTGGGSNVGCLYPDHPVGGLHEVENCLDKGSSKCRGLPGTLADHSTSIVFKCANGFRLSSVNNRSLCLSSHWYPDPPTCLKLCKPLRSNSVDLTCIYKGGLVDCTSPMLPSTKVKAKCKPSFSFQGNPISDDPICDTEGGWTEPLFRCKPTCGISVNNKNVATLVSYGTPTSAVEYPWHAGLYSFHKDLQDYELFCGGSIITPYMILTAAHCVKENESQMDPSQIIVAIGKTNRSWSIIDPQEQRINVSQIYIHSDYRGANDKYAFDIAILELALNIKIGTVAMPICLETIPPWTHIPNGKNGTVVGFGRNENNVLSPVLMVANLTYLDQKTCARRAGNFRPYITHDKFCARYFNGAGVQQGDSGGGIIFLKPENNLYFIRGIVSTKPKDQNTYATFTNISEKAHVNFIKEVRQALSPRRD